MLMFAVTNAMRMRGSIGGSKGPRPSLAAQLRALLLVASLLAITTRSEDDEVTAGSTCQAVLNAGIFNTIRTTFSASTYFLAHQAGCTPGAYYYENYLEDTNSSVPTGLAVTVHTFARFIMAPNTYAAGSSRYFTTYAHFEDVRYKMFTYLVTACGSSPINSASHIRVQALSTFIEPAVYQSYVACLNLYSRGIRMTHTSVFSWRTVSVDLLYVPNLSTDTASLLGATMTPPGAATCSVFRTTAAAAAVTGAAAAADTVRKAAVAAVSPPPVTRRSPSPRKQPPPPPSPKQQNLFQFQFVPNTVSSIFCQLTPGADTAGSPYTVINVYSTAGAFQLLLYNDPAPSQLEGALNRISALEAKASQVKTGVASLDFGCGGSSGSVCGGNAINATATVVFPQPFAAPPTVTLSLMGLDSRTAADGGRSRFRLAPIGITAAGFVVQATAALSNDCLCAVEVSYTAVLNSTPA